MHHHAQLFFRQGLAVGLRPALSSGFFCLCCPILWDHRCTPLCPALGWTSKGIGPPMWFQPMEHCISAVHTTTAGPNRFVKTSDDDSPVFRKHDMSIIMLFCYKTILPKFNYTFKLLVKSHLLIQNRGNKAVCRKQGSSLLIQHYKEDLL